MRQSSVMREDFENFAGLDFLRDISPELPEA
jgi:hypothetical protein